LPTFVADNGHPVYLVVEMVPAEANAIAVGVPPGPPPMTRYSACWAFIITPLLLNYGKSQDTHRFL
jgi:hypothetical protein